MIYINARFLTQNLTGVQRFALEICRALSKIREDIILLVPNYDFILDKSILNEFFFQEVKGGKGYFWEQITLPKYLKLQGSPLLINLCNTAPVFYNNKIITIHDINFIKFPYSYSWKFKAFYRFSIPLMINTTRKILTVSDFSKKELINHYKIIPENITVIYNAVSGNFKPINRKKNNTYKSYALAVSSPVFHKNFPRMINAFLRSNVEIDLKIIGSSTNLFNLQKNSSILDSRIKFLGRISDQELIDLYQNADFFIFPSLYEGFGIPPLEAQACGCPVISSNAASMPEVLQDSTLYFDPYNVDEIKKCIERIAVDEDFKQNLIEKGLKNTERFSWHNSAKQLHSVIEEILT